MKLLYVGPVSPIRGGIAQHGDRLVGSLREQGHDVTVATWRAQYPRLLYRGVQRSTNEPFDTGVDSTLAWYNPLSWLRVRRLTRHFERVVVQWVHPFHALPLALIVRGAPDRTVAIVHNARPHERFTFADRLTRFALRHAATLITHAADQATVLGEITDRRDVVMTALPPNLDVDQVEPTEGPPWRLLFAGYVREYKGVDTAIEALGILRRDGVDATLTIVGSFWEPETTSRDLAERVGVSEQVRIESGYADDATLIDAVQHHHVLLAPYRSATQSGLIPLALSGGRPVVATTVGGLPDQVPPGAGATAPPDDPAAFAGAIHTTLARYAAARAAAVDGAPTWRAVVDLVTEEG